ncbi:hypothetical protein HPB50_020983 [Hyalomma asiaticum]|uniref:Uncharacterized protein n=1 Tax=Hyalomma asiaticum TaxID=266040 RepID=A0ACB7T9R1_HYAAI|nr:hypothetical protein HPB50_020983 [Hyalomma asiaticum]
MEVFNQKQSESDPQEHRPRHHQGQVVTRDFSCDGPQMSETIVSSAHLKGIAAAKEDECEEEGRERGLSSSSRVTFEITGGHVVTCRNHAWSCSPANHDAPQPV